MIPDFDDLGNLPPGIHPATFEEIVARFGWQSDLRRVQSQSLEWLIDLAKRAGAERVILNGSFVTEKLEPNDVDCLVLFKPHVLQERDEREFLAGLPFLEIQIVDDVALNFFLQRMFSVDRDWNPKGLVEVLL
jgi:hypothetical protein